MGPQNSFDPSHFWKSLILRIRMADNLAYNNGDDNQKGIEIDRTPHDLFIEMDELILSPTFGCFEWVEQSRWIKYEEAREEGSERWSKPHVSSLTFQSVINLKTQLERGLLLLDLQLADMSQIFQNLVEQLIETGMLEKEQKNKGTSMFDRSISSVKFSYIYQQN